MLEFEQFVSDPAPNVQMYVDANMGPVGDMLATLSQVGFWVGASLSKRANACLAQDVCSRDIIKSRSTNCSLLVCACLLVLHCRDLKTHYIAPLQVSS